MQISLFTTYSEAFKTDLQWVKKVRGQTKIIVTNYNFFEFMLKERTKKRMDILVILKEFVLPRGKLLEFFVVDILDIFQN